MLRDVLEELGSTGTAVVVAVVSMVAVYVSVIVATRLAGPRSLAQMSAFDFVATVAIGSIIASVGLGTVPLVEGLVAVVTLFALQFLVSTLRRRHLLRGVIDNEPLLLVRDGELLHDHMRSARFTHEDLRSHLRRADVTDLASVRAVVLETTGDVSILTGEGDLDVVLEGVRGVDVDGAGGARPRLDDG